MALWGGWNDILIEGAAPSFDEIKLAVAKAFDLEPDKIYVGDDAWWDEARLKRIKVVVDVFSKFRGDFPTHMDVIPLDEVMYPESYDFSITKAIARYLNRNLLLSEPRYIDEELGYFDYVLVRVTGTMSKVRLNADFFSPSGDDDTEGFIIEHIYPND